MGLTVSAWVVPHAGAQETSGRQEQQEQKEQADEIFSGPQTGEAMPELAALQLMEESTEPVSIVPGAAEKLQMMIFVHERTRPAFGLLRGLATWSKELGEKIDSSVVFLTDNVGETRQWSVNARRAIPDGARMFVSADGIEGPGAWGLNRNVTMTIVLGRDGKTLDNFAIVQPSALDDMTRVSASIAKVLGIDSPTGEQLANWLGQRAMNGRAAPATVDIRPLLAPVIQKNATPEKVEAAAKKVAERAAEDSEFRVAVGNACRRIVGGGVLENYGTEPAQVWLKKWAEEFKAADKDEMKDKSDENKTDKAKVENRDG